MNLTDPSDSSQNNGSVTVDTATGRMKGNAKFGSRNYIAYFCPEFAGGVIRDNGIFEDGRASSEVKYLEIDEWILCLEGLLSDFNSELISSD